MLTKQPRKSAKRRTPIRPTPKPKVVKIEGREPVPAEQIELIPIKGTEGKGGGPGGERWNIQAAGARAGVVYINVIDEAPIGRHASLQIYLNEASQGRRIGRIAYRKAAEASQHNEIYAHMRKSNIASRRAAEEAGFKDVTPPSVSQLILKWSRTA
ncbi:MAG TPA: GNAT family N-acetyltransferase [Rhizomicrobium sp.]|jgi:RimJ/RimL family protein N-acetyltransferase|nr:GNAT family N-acetyltransferase [Rhizomicrobium sp.]